MRYDSIVKISIIMPVFNDEKYIEESISTVVNQTMDDIELICINDGSTDNSLKILKELKKRHDFIKIFNQYNQGSGKARNNGIKKASGEYIAFLDSDDRFVDNDALEKMYNVAKKYDADMVSANLKGITVKNELVNNDDGVERFTEEKIISGSEYGIPYAFYKNIFKRSFLNEHQFKFPDLKRGQDPVFLSEVISKVKVIPVLPIDLYGFRYAPTGGLSKINTFEKKWDYIKHFRETFNILRQAKFYKIFEDYKEKLFLFINHAQNSSDEVVYTIVHEIFKDDLLILKECEEYFNIKPNSKENPVKKNIKKDILPPKENIYDLKIQINQLKNDNLNLSHENELLNDEIHIISGKHNIGNKLMLNNLRLLDENKYLFDNNKKLRNKVNQLYEINYKILNNKTSSDSLIELSTDQFEYFVNEYNSLIDKLYDAESIGNDYIGKELKQLNLKQKSQDEKLSLIKKEFEEVNLYSSKSKLRNVNMAYVLFGFPTLSETFILNELKWLRRNNINVKVFSFGKPARHIDLDFDIETYRFDSGGDLSANLEKLLIKHKIDFMHTHFVYPTGTKYTYPLAKKLKMPFTLFAHAFDIFIKENDEINNLKEMTNSEYCKGIFTLSNYHKNYLIERGVPEEKIILTRQATEYEIIPVQPKNNKVTKIISISRFVEKKGLDGLINAANLLKDENFEFSIFGFGILEKSLQKQISDLNLDNISIKGALNGSEEIKSAFKDADLLVSPCKIASNGDQDGIPTVLFESMGYGVPVLTTSVSAIPEIIKDNKNGFIVEPNNPKLLAEKIKYISNLSPEKLFEIRSNAQNDVQEVSSIKKTMGNVLDVWSNINL